MIKSVLVVAPKRVLNRIKFLLLALIIFIAAIAILLASGKLVDLSEKRITLVADQLNIQSSNIPNLVQKAQAKEAPKSLKITQKGVKPPEFSGLAVLVQDWETGTILDSKNIHTRLSPASTTKLMTALVGVSSYQLGDILSVRPGDLVSGSSMGLHVGETVTFRGLLYGMLLNSGNDAAFAIASNYPGGVNAFIGAMNQKARQLNLADTNFLNPAGFDGNGHYSSAFDLAKIAHEVVNNGQLAKIVATKETSVLAMDRSKEHFLHNLNQLLDEPGVIGIKTGFTEKSGENLIGLVERNNHKVLTVVLGSKDRFGETKRLMDWVYSNFVWE